MDWKRTALVFGGVSLFQAGWILGQLHPGDALAQQPAARAAEPSTPRVRCRTFTVDPTRSGMVETSDRTTEIGQWVGAQEEAGWQLYGVDFEVGQKATGYPQGWLQVCVQPA